MDDSTEKPSHLSEALKKQIRNQEIFIEALLIHGSIAETCRQLKQPPSTVYQWKRENEQFSAACEDALKKGLYDRLFEGSREPKAPAVLIFAAKSILGLSDQSGEVERLRKDLAQTRKELEQMRIAVHHATKHDPALQAAIAESIQAWSTN